MPDADGLGIVAYVVGSVISGQACTYHYYQEYHHLQSHGWPGALVGTALLTCFARQKPPVAVMCLITFHLHLLCDLIGSRGPTAGDLWPICYSEPIFRHPVWFWKGQWRLDGWQNRIITVVLVLTELGLAPRCGYSCLEIFDRKADAVFVGVLQKWQAALLGRSSSG